MVEDSRKLKAVIGIVIESAGANSDTVDKLAKMKSGTKNQQIVLN